MKLIITTKEGSQMQKTCLQKRSNLAKLIMALFAFCCLMDNGHVLVSAANKQSDETDNSKIASDNKMDKDSYINEFPHENPDSLNEARNISLSKKDIYQAGFQIKRAHQISAVKEILKIGDYAKKYKMVTLVLEKIFQILSSSKIIITQSSYVPGQDFPENEKELEALAHVVENTAFFGDILLRMPDITHKIYQSKNDWRVLTHWSIGYCNETGLFKGANERLISLVAQELNLIPRDKNYVNPYKLETHQKQNIPLENGKKKNSSKRKERKKRKNGPRLSRTDL